MHARGLTLRSRTRQLACAAWLLLLSLQFAEAHGPWVVLKDCRLAPNESNDGDSFHVKADGKEYIFRLYFVDAPETDDEFVDRVSEQAKYFGVTVPQVVQLGAFAKKFTDEKLARPFTVRTCLQDAMGRSRRERFYAFIETNDGDLAELLVANGLARVHGSAATPIGLSSPEVEWQKLQRLERDAKLAKVGGWGAAAGRMTARLTTQPSKTGGDSFTAFFHPERVAAALEQDQSTSQRAATPPSLVGAPPRATSPALQQLATAAARLDVNSATAAELQNVPGIGPVLAQRIVDGRPFKSADDLRNVKGIGEKTYEKIRSYFM